MIFAPCKIVEFGGWESFNLVSAGHQQVALWSALSTNFSSFTKLLLQQDAHCPAATITNTNFKPTLLQRKLGELTSLWSTNQIIWCLFTQPTPYFFPCTEEDHFWSQISIMSLLWEPPTPILLWTNPDLKLTSSLCPAGFLGALKVWGETCAKYFEAVIFFWWAPFRQAPFGESWLMGWSNQNMSFLQSSGPYRPYLSLSGPRSRMIRCHSGNKQMSQ